MTPADVARIAGVSRSAVSNWRRRFPDFPKPAGGTPASPVFVFAEVEAWLRAQGKGGEVSSEVRAWQLLRSACDGDALRALALAGRVLAGRQDRGTTAARAELGEAVVAALRETTAEQAPGAAFEGLHARYAASSARTAATTPDLVARIVAALAGTTTGTVFDPACGTGTLLLAAGGPDAARRHGQDLNADAATIAGLRIGWQQDPAGTTAGSTADDVRTGDSLRADAFPGLRAEVVVCAPPTAVRDWGHDELLLRTPWEFSLPPRGESELAWLLHCHHHTAPGGTSAVLLPTAVAARRAGRRIRAELVRSGTLCLVAALPAGMTAEHPHPLHVWVLRRPDDHHRRPARTVRMLDATAADPAALDQRLTARRHTADPTADLQDRVPGVLVADVPLVDLVDADVDLTPGRYVTAALPDHAAEIRHTRDRLRALLDRLAADLDTVPATRADLDVTGTLPLAELLRAGHIALDADGEPEALTHQLDTGFLRAWVRHSPDNRRRNTSGSGTYRTDARGALIPQLDLDRQRAYAAAFRHLDALADDIATAGQLAADLVRLAREGLTLGRLNPPDPR